MDAASLLMLPLEQFAWPVTYGYIVATPWGTTRQSLTVNVPQLEGMPDATRLLGRLLWGTVTAPAVIGDVKLTHVSVTFWKSLGVAIPMPIQELRGNLIGRASPREHTPQMVMLTGHADDDGKRRFFFPGAPRGWVKDGLLQKEGWEHLLPHAAGCMLGLQEPALSSGLEWLIAYPGVLESTLENFTGVAFRRVTHLRVCHHTDKAPEVTGIA